MGSVEQVIKGSMMGLAVGVSIIIWSILGFMGITTIIEWVLQYV